MDLLKASLYKHYGWSVFKKGQREILEAVLNQRDVLGVLPTGGGKSLCFQLPALINQGIVIVFSPLVAIMEDQVSQLKQRGIAAACFHAGIEKTRREEVINLIKENKINLLYLAPERLNQKSIRQLLIQKYKQKTLVAIAIDEAHCISSWGHNFRPDYRTLGDVRNLCPEVPIAAFSATASPKVRADIIRRLNLRKPFVHVCSARRKNLFYSMIRRKKQPLSDVLQAIKKSRGASLIYVRTRRLVDEWARLLQKEGIPTISYHAGLNTKVREKALNDFLKEKKPVLVGTVAFGMGIDRSDVGLVLHLSLPSTPESYLQESGRAGRDGLEANCLVLYSPIDRVKFNWTIKSLEQNHQINKQNIEEKIRKNFALEQIRNMENIAEGDTCFEQALLLSIGEIVNPCGRCSICIEGKATRDWSQSALKILELVKSLPGIDSQSIHSKLDDLNNDSDKNWRWLVRRMVSDELISEAEDGSHRIFLCDIGRRFIETPWPLIYAA